MEEVRVMRTDGFYQAGCICFAFCIRHCQCLEDCGYYDASRTDRTSFLECKDAGCCGDFHNRYCCFGPLLITGIVFGSLIGVLILFLIVGVCYHNHKERLKVRDGRMTIVASEDIPRPSPVSAPPVYNQYGSRPPVFTQQPFRTTRRVGSIDETAHHPPPTNLHLPSIAASRKT